MFFSKIFNIVLFVFCFSQITLCNRLNRNNLEIDSLSIMLNKQMNSIGVVYFIKDEDIMDTVKNLTLYDKNGNIYANLSMKYDGFFTIEGQKYPVTTIEDSLCSLELKHNFSPKEFQPIDGVYIQFECKEITKKYYEVFINKEKTQTKFIKKDDTYFAFEPWSKHIFNCFIGFSPIRNPLRKTPKEDSSVLEYKTYEIMNYDFRIIKINGDWMQIQSIYSSCEAKQRKRNKYKGWIKWLENKKLIIKMYYDCQGKMLIPKY